MTRSVHTVVEEGGSAIDGAGRVQQAGDRWPLTEVRQEKDDGKPDSGGWTWRHDLAPSNVDDAGLPEPADRPTAPLDPECHQRPDLAVRSMS
jgi:hypothetical protein